MKANPFKRYLARMERRRAWRKLTHEGGRARFSKRAVKRFKKMEREGGAGENDER